jgi:hypothetical protein
MLCLITSVADLTDPRQFEYRGEIFVESKDIDDTLQPMMPSDAEEDEAAGGAVNMENAVEQVRLAALKELLAEEAQKQGSPFDPYAPVGYVYLSHRQGYLFYNTVAGHGGPLTLPLGTDSTDSTESQEGRRPRSGSGMEAVAEGKKPGIWFRLFGRGGE